MTSKRIKYYNSTEIHTKQRKYETSKVPENHQRGCCTALPMFQLLSSSYYLLEMVIYLGGVRLIAGGKKYIYLITPRQQLQNVLQPFKRETHVVDAAARENERFTSAK